jgi:glycosyltransferase involved in cell wall biosynthesis
VIRSASEGWLIPPADVDALRSALLEVTTLPDERARRGAAGRRAAERIGSPADNAARLIALLTGLRAGRLPAALVAT